MSELKSHYKAILFDLGSTLIEYENHDWAFLGKQGITAGYPYLKSTFPKLMNRDEFTSVFYNRFKILLDGRKDYEEIDLFTACDKVLRQFQLDINPEIVNKFIGLYYQPVTDQISLIPGAEDILRLIKRNNLIIGLVSNSIFMESSHRAEMQKFG